MVGETIMIQMHCQSQMSYNLSVKWAGTVHVKGKITYLYE